MSQPYIGQIEVFGFGFAPRGWALCQGQLLPINQNQALFSLLGTTYGGDGKSTFALPDLRGRVPIGQGSGQGLTPRVIGEAVGEPAHTLLTTEMPAHSHGLMAISNPVTANNVDAPGATVVLAQTVGADKSGNPIPVNIYATDAAPGQALSPAAIGSVGGQPHANMMPYVTLNLCIALQGIYPSRS